MVQFLESNNKSNIQKAITKGIVVLNNLQIKKEIIMEIYLEMNRNENSAYQNMWDVTEAENKVNVQP